MNPVNASWDWDKLASEIRGLEVDIYPSESCRIVSKIGSGSAMSVFEGLSSLSSVMKCFRLHFNGTNRVFVTRLKGTCMFGDVEKKVALKEHHSLSNRNIKPNVMRRIFEELRHEIQLMKRLKYHPNIVQIHGVVFIDNKPLLIVELASETLDDYLDHQHKTGKTVDWHAKTMLCIDVLEGLRGLHAANIVHGDIKGENILVVISGKSVRAKISDFGFSSTLSSARSTYLRYVLFWRRIKNDA